MPTPTRIRVLTFQVGFGDCFLLRFEYARGRARHVLIDFGSYPKASWLRGDGMRRVAQAISDECGGKLDALVATHRHADHINGFTTDQDDPGSVIAACDPDVVVQPWTEDPDAKRNARRPTASFMSSGGAGNGAARAAAFERGLAFVESLDAARGLLPLIRDEVRALEAEGRTDLARELAFQGQNGLGNLAAVENLIEMGRRGDARYVYHGADAGLGAVLPGVRVTVLGPPTLEQSDEIAGGYARSAPGEYWVAQVIAARRLAEKGRDPFEGSDLVSYEEAPPYARWLITRLRTLRGRQLLEIVRTMDKVLNNTSVILLFEVGRRKLLFPGDAQLENWSYALARPGTARALQDVDFYKVGHHGSLNATPKTALWENFTRRGRGLQTAVSTLKNVHGGKTGKPTEVPRRPLMSALRRDSTLLDTQKLPKEAGAFATITIDV